MEIFLDFVYRRTRFAPRLTDFNKLQRFFWCQRNVNNDFKNYLFVDETAVRSLEVPLYHVRQRAERPEAIKTSTKIRFKVNVWGGISFRGATPFVVSHNKIIMMIYIKMILN